MNRRKRMSSAGYGVFTAAAVLLCTCGCEREERRFRESPPAMRWTTIQQSELQPGPVVLRRATENPFEGNAWALAEGKRLYGWYNCAGCHFQGGGGIGPPLMDDVWIYGEEPANIFATIVEGRPNGMPSFAGRIPDQQVWKLVGYVRSLSGLTPKLAAPDPQAAPEDDADPGPPREAETGEGEPEAGGGL